MKDKKHPDIYWSTSSKEGGCSSCNRHGTEHGDAEHRVLVIRGPGTLTRMCVACRNGVLKCKPPPMKRAG